MSRKEEFDFSSDFVEKSKEQDEPLILEDFDDDELRLLLDQSTASTDDDDDYNFSFLENESWIQEVLHKEYNRNLYDSDIPGQIYTTPVGETPRSIPSLHTDDFVTVVSQDDAEYIDEGATTRPEKRSMGSVLEGAHELEKYMHGEGNKPDHESKLQTSKEIRPGPPELTITKDQYSVKTGDSVTLECIVHANPEVGTIRWTRDVHGATTEIDNKSKRFSGNNPTNPSLTILSASIADEGCYTCFAFNFMGEKNSRQIELSVQKAETDNMPTPRPQSEALTEGEFDSRLGTPQNDEEQPKIDIESDTYVARSGFPVSLVVLIDAYPEVENVFWTKKSGEVTSKLSLSTPRIQCNIDDPSLKIDISKTTDAGVYRCCSRNSAGTGFSKDISLIVIGNDDISEEIITYISQHLRKGWQKIMIKLQIVKKKELDEVSKMYPENTQSQIKECLNRFVKNKKANPDLMYHLIAMLDSNNQKDLVKEVRHRLDSPLITMKQRRCTSKVGNTVEIACDVRSSSSISELRWEKITEGNIQTINHNSKGYDGITIENPSLVLDNIRHTDQGVYECVAVNESGIGRSDGIEVTIVSDDKADYDIPTVDISVPNYKVELGQSVTLECKVRSTQDIVSVIWLKQTTETSYSINSKTQGVSGSTPQIPSLTITSVSMTDIGSYVCCASNAEGIGNSKAITLDILEGILKSSFTVNKTTISIKEGEPFNEVVEAVAVITNPALNLSERYISKNISRIVGKTLQNEVKKLYPNKIKNGTIVVPIGENLRCKSILLCVLDNGLYEKNIEKAQSNYLHNCLTEATKEGFKSIALPICYSLPGEKLSIQSISALASSLYDFLKDYINKNCNTTLTDIRIIIRKQDDDIVKEFEEAARTIKVTEVPVVPQKVKDISVNYLSVIVCHGYIENSDVDVIVHYITPLINQNSNELSVSLFKLGGLELQQLFNEKIFKKYSSNIEVGQLIPCGAGNLKCERVYNCCLSKKNPLMTGDRQKALKEIVQECLNFAHLHGRKSIAFPFWEDHAFDARTSYTYKLNGIRKFVEKNPKSSLKVVYIVMRRGRRTDRTKALDQPDSHRDKRVHQHKLWKEMSLKDTRPPQNWTSYSRNETVKNMEEAEQASHRMLELSKDSELYKAINAFWEESCDHSKKIKRIERLESLTLWKKYGIKRSKLSCKALQIGGLFKSIERVPYSSGQLKTMACEKSSLLHQLSSNINEQYLFCLTSNKVRVQNVLASGLAMQKGKFGYGAYFADKLHSIDENSSYVEGKEKKMILARVALGETCVLQRENEDMSFPPCKICNFDNCVHRWRYDSVTGFSERKECIIYDRNQAYPEYVITYE